MKELKQLDDVLRLFLKTETRILSMGELHQKTTIGIDLAIMIKKLEKDGYIEIAEGEIPQVLTIDYFLNYDGVIFISCGGYETKYLKDIMAIETRKVVDRLTYAIALGSVVCAVYYILEILKFFHCIS